MLESQEDKEEGKNEKEKIGIESEKEEKVER